MIHIETHQKLESLFNFLFFGKVGGRTNEDNVDLRIIYFLKLD